MLLIAEWWRRSLKLAVLLLFTAELRLIDSRPMRSFIRRHGPPRSSAVTDVEAGSTSTTPGRWMTPCAGGTTAETPVYHSASSSTDASSSDVDDLTSQHGRRKLLRRLSRQMERLADRVDRLKLRYVSIRLYLPIDPSPGQPPGTKTP